MFDFLIPRLYTGKQDLTPCGLYVYSALYFRCSALYSETDFSCKYINYNENPVDRWCFENAKLQVNSYQVGMLVKSESQKRIDGAVTLVMLEEMYSRYANDFQNLLK